MKQILELLRKGEKEKNAIREVSRAEAVEYLKELYGVPERNANLFIDRTVVEKLYADAKVIQFLFGDLEGFKLNIFEMGDKTCFSFGYQIYDSIDFGGPLPHSMWEKILIQGAVLDNQRISGRVEIKKEVYHWGPMGNLQPKGMSRSEDLELKLCRPLTLNCLKEIYSNKKKSAL